MRHALAAVAALFTLIPAVAAQQPGVLSRFDAAAIKENRSGTTNVEFQILPGGRFGAVNAPLRDIVRIAIALGVGTVQLDGLPDWAASTRYDITAKAEGEPTREQILRMLRALVVERFGLQYHTEQRDIPVYFLVPAHADRTPGPRLRRSVVNCHELTAAAQEGTPLPASDRILCGRTMRDGTMLGGGLPMQTIADSIDGYTGRRVFDRTGLTGDWDFDLTFAEAAPAGTPPRPDAPTIFTALPDQLGLRLESGRAPVEITVIDRLERPTPD
jgi:uncharacterized protein (TIGR03435 family)